MDNTARMVPDNIKSFELLQKENENLTEYLFEKQGIFEQVAGQSVSDISPMAKSAQET